MFVWRGTARDPIAYQEARRLRAELGLPFKRIADRLGVSPATAHLWTRDIALTPEQHHRNRTGPRGPANPRAVAARAQAWAKRCRERRAMHQLEGRRRAGEAEPLHLAGCMLYWAEGAKSRNTVKLVNSDPALIVFFARFLRESLGVRNEDMRMRLNVYLNNGMTIEEIETYWLERLQLPRSCLRKHTLNAKPTSSSGSKPRKLPYGVCSLSVSSTDLVQHIYGAIQEYAGFDNPGWLD